MGGASCSPPTSPRPRSPCRACATSSTPARPGSRATAAGSRCSACRSSRSRRRRPTSGPAAAAGSAPGICIRLYAEDDFAERPEFTEPEILRTNLASVILQMTAIGLGDVARVPVRRAARLGVDPRRLRCCSRSSARSSRRSSGPRRSRRSGASSPGSVDPRLGRMVLEAERHGCVREVLVIASALSIQDPRERPAGAPRAGQRVAQPLRRRRAPTCCRSSRCGTTCASSSASCRQPVPPDVPDEFLNYLRVREWLDLFSQLRAGRRRAQHPARRPTTAHPDHVHQRCARRPALAHRDARPARAASSEGARGRAS